MKCDYVEIGQRWVANYLLKHGRDKIFSAELAHHGVKGQKWGIRNGPPYPIDRSIESVEKYEKGGIVRKTIQGHKGNPPRGIPNSVSDHIGRDGKVDKRAFYDRNGWKAMDLHTTDHKNPKEHPYGKHGEHMHYYEWYEDGRMKSDVTKEITEVQRKENQDIL